ncbi:MAG: BamA/TamA family outer membrane protein, partial [Longimicrobiales bacterium]
EHDRLQWLDRAVVSLRGDVQLANDPLLSGERIAVGGPQTVRGFQRNRLVRDNALIGSLELRFPIWGRDGSEPRVELSPFVDVAYAWNDRDPGAGLHIQASWAQPIRRGVQDGEGLQRDGVYMELIWNAF